VDDEVAICTHVHRDRVPDGVLLIIVSLNKREKAEAATKAALAKRQAQRLKPNRS